MGILINIIAFLIAIFVLVLAHEFGHFWVARKLGTKVERFSIGFGKPLLRWQGKSNIEYVIAPILLGGYVKLNEESYQQKSVWRRMAIMLAGVTANIMLAILLFWLVFTIGIKVPKPIIGKVIPKSIAYQAGLKSGNEIKNVDGRDVFDWQGVTIAIISRMGDRNQLIINGHYLNLDKWEVNNLNPDPIQSLGIEPYYPAIPAVINKVMLDGPAKQIGLQPQDRILSINNQKIIDWYDFIKYIHKHPDQKVTLTIDRFGEYIVLTGVIGSKSGPGLKKIGYLGVASLPVKWPQDMFNEQHYPPWQAFYPALQRTWLLLNFNFIVLAKMLTGKISLHVLGGPITIFSAAEVAFKQGIVIYTEFLALLSVMLAFVNILPIPALDGGNFVFLLLEAIIRRPVPIKIQTFALRLGMIILAILIFIAIGNDLLRMIFT
jgi:regulator of sigma E protease